MKEKDMNFWIKAPLITALAVSTLFGGDALAGHDGHGGKRGEQVWRDANPGQVKERLTRRVELQLARLELALALTPAQQPAWAGFKKDIAAHTEAVLKEIEGKRDAGQPKTALEHLQRAEDASKQRARLLSDTRKTVEVFYDKLGAAQKAVFDAEFSKRLHPFHAEPAHAGHFGRKGTRGGRD
jgi:hypothetical protein